MEPSVIRQCSHPPTPWVIWIIDSSNNQGFPGFLAGSGQKTQSPVAACRSTLLHCRYLPFSTFSCIYADRTQTQMPILLVIYFSIYNLFPQRRSGRHIVSKESVLFLDNFNWKNASRGCQSDVERVLGERSGGNFKEWKESTEIRRGKYVWRGGGDVDARPTTTPR